MEKRNSKQRQLIFECVLNRSDHPTGDEIYQDVIKTNPKISRATVFRNLKVLSDDLKITRVKMSGADRYDWRKDKHYHIECIKCHKVVDAKLDYLIDLDKEVDNDQNFMIKYHRITFEGVCQDCLKKEAV